MSDVIFVKCFSCGKEHEIIDYDFEDDGDFICDCGQELNFRN